MHEPDPPTPFPRGPPPPPNISFSSEVSRFARTRERRLRSIPPASSRIVVLEPVTPWTPSRARRTVIESFSPVNLGLFDRHLRHAEAESRSGTLYAAEAALAADVSSCVASGSFTG